MNSIGRLTVFALLFLNSCSDMSDNYFPFKEGKTWSYSINLFSSYTGKEYKKRIFIKNIKTQKQNRGFELIRLHSNGNYYKYFLENGSKKLSRISVLIKNGQGLTEPINKVIYPDILFRKEKWTSMEQLFLTKGYQPPLLNFKPETIFEMNYALKKKINKFRHRGKLFKNCFYIIGYGSTSFIADTRSGPLNVKVESEEWICENIGMVKEKRSENTEASAFGKTTMTKELVF